MGITYLVYIFVLFVSVYFAYLGSKYHFSIGTYKINGSVFYYISLLIIIFISGFRGDTVGLDSSNYKSAFFLSDPDSSFSEYLLILHKYLWEPGFMLINWILRRIDVNYSVVLIIYASIIWGCLYKFFSEKKQLFYIGIYFSITFGFLFFTFNGIRQSFALVFLFLAVQHVDKRNFIKFLIYIFIAGMFHYSALFFIPLYYVLPWMKFETKTWFILFLISILAKATWLFYLIGKASNLVPQYGNYFENISIRPDSGLTLGVLYQIALGFVLLMFYKLVTKNNSYYLLIYNLTFIGLILYNLFNGYVIINRFSIYLLFFQIFAFTFLVEYLIKIKEFPIIIIIAITFFTAYLYKIYVNESGCSPFNFVFLG